MTRKDSGTADVLSQTAHDLRNVISMVRAEAQLGLIKFERSQDAERMKEALLNILEHSDTMVDILRDQLEMLLSNFNTDKQRPSTHEQEQEQD